METCEFYNNCSKYLENRTNSDVEFSSSEWTREYSQQVMLNSAIVIIFLIIGVIGNIIVIIIYSHRMKNIIADRYFIPILAILDLLATCISATFNLARNFRQYTFPGDATCKCLIYLAYVLSFSSLNMLLIIAVHRFLKVCRPFHTQMTLTWKRMAVGICVTVTALFHIPIITFYGIIPVQHSTLNITGHQCNKLLDPNTSRSLEIYQPIDTVFNAGLIVSITVLYGIIGRTIYKKTSIMKVNKGENDTICEIKLQRKGKLKSNDSFQEDTSEDVLEMTSSDNGTHGNSGGKPPENPHNRDAVFTVSGNDKTNNTNNNKTRYRHKMGKKIKSHFHLYRFTYMFMLISLLAFLSYLPPTVLISLESRNHHFWKNISGGKLQILLLLRRMYMLNNIVNPFVYGLFDTIFRGELINLMCAWRQPKQTVDQNTKCKTEIAQKKL